MDSEIEYRAWRKEYQSILESFADNRVLLSFSGGKDSSLALYLISKASKEFGFDFETHAGVFPIHRYPDSEKKRLEAYWKKHEVDIIWHKFLETDERIKNADNPCHSCQKIRKKLLKNFISEEIHDLEKLVLIVSFSLWDIVGYSVEHLLADKFQNGTGKHKIEKNKRFTETAQRFYPLIRMKEGYRVFRPLIQSNGSDIIATIKKRSIPSLSIPCEFRDFRPKRVLEAYYEKMGLHFDYMNVLNFAKNSFDLPDITFYSSMEKERYLSDIF